MYMLQQSNTFFKVTKDWRYISTCSWFSNDSKVQVFWEINQFGLTYFFFQILRSQAGKEVQISGMPSLRPTSLASWAPFIWLCGWSGWRSHVPDLSTGLWSYSWDENSRIISWANTILIPWSKKRDANLEEFICTISVFFPFPMAFYSYVLPTFQLKKH